MPAGRAIDCEKAARWTKATGARRVAKARIADMAGFVAGVKGVRCCGCRLWGSDGLVVGLQIVALLTR